MDKKICKTLFSEYAIPLKSWTYCTVIIYTGLQTHTHASRCMCAHTHNIKVEEDGGTNGEREGLGEIIR